MRRFLLLKQRSPYSSIKLQKKLDQLDAENLDFVVERLMLKQKLTKSEALEARGMFLQFVSLIYISRRPIVPTKMIDCFWHEFLMFTKQYREFCYKYFDKFIDHQPRIEGKPSYANRDYFLETIQLLDDSYGVSDLF